MYPADETSQKPSAKLDAWMDILTAKATDGRLDCWDSHVSGTVVNVDARASEPLVGIILRKGRFQPRDPRYPAFKIEARSQHPSGPTYSAGKIALLEFHDWRRDSPYPTGIIKSIVGDAGSADAEHNALVAWHGFS